MVLNSYHMMYSNIVKELVFQYIEHGILIYNIVYDITMYLFQVLPLLHWTSKFSKIMIKMYFGHHFPLTSHIMGHLLSTKMALPHVGTQKDNLDWSSLNTIDGHELWCIFLRPVLYIYIRNFWLHTRLCALQITCHIQVFELQPMYICIHEFPLNNSCVIHDLPILIPAYTLIIH